LKEEAHIGLSALAQCADGTLPEDEARTVREHLAKCRSCLAAYVDAVRYRAAWLVDSQAFRLEGGDRALAGLPRSADRSAAESRRSPGAFRRIALVASVAALVAVSVRIAHGPDAPSLAFRLDPATLDATVRSAAGGLVLPGAAAHADGTLPERRSGPASSTLELEAEVRAAIASYEGGSRGPDAAARLVAALLADGDVAAANDYAREALQAYPDHVPLLVFAAAAKTRANDLPGAERLLRRASRRAPRDPVVALDLGMLLCRSGNGADPRRWLEQAAASRAAHVAARARRELSSCGRGQ
jgi:tetratricopeptide (TPR) repeat protein